jgi:hypothetical protein
VPATLRRGNKEGPVFLSLSVCISNSFVGASMYPSFTVLLSVSLCPLLLCLGRARTICLTAYGRTTLTRTATSVSCDANKRPWRTPSTLHRA